MRLKSLLLPGVAAAVVLVVAVSLASSRAVAPMMQSSAAVKGTTAVVKDKTAAVRVYMYSFMPDTVTVRVGTRITFTNHDQTAHTATALNGAFDTGTINPGQSKTIVVKRLGTFPYHCLFHAFMTGTIKVVS